MALKKGFVTFFIYPIIKNNHLYECKHHVKANFDKKNIILTKENLNILFQNE